MAPVDRVPTLPYPCPPLLFVWYIPRMDAQNTHFLKSHDVKLLRYIHNWLMSWLSMEVWGTIHSSSHFWRDFSIVWMWPITSVWLFLDHLLVLGVLICYDVRVDVDLLVHLWVFRGLFELINSKLSNTQKFLHIISLRFFPPFLCSSFSFFFFKA